MQRARSRSREQVAQWLQGSVAGRRTPGVAAYVVCRGETVFDPGFGLADPVEHEVGRGDGAGSASPDPVEHEPDQRVGDPVGR